MFQPPVFRETRIEPMHELMATYPFATLVSAATGVLSADHVPLVLQAEGSEKGKLQGHFAAGNPLFRGTDDPFEVLAIFHGPQTYISPGWYPSKQDHGKVVPTWNYVVVHARGTLRFHRETEWLLAHLQDLTSRHESHRALPWAVADAPDAFVAQQLRALVGFEIEITELEGTWKLSQNKNEADHGGVRDGLAAEATPQADAVADLVQSRR